MTKSMKKVRLLTLAICVSFLGVLTGCNSNNSSGNSQSNDYTDEIENVTNDITETENAVQKVVFNSSLDVQNYLEGKKFTNGDTSVKFSTHGWCEMDGHEYDATLRVTKFHETTADVVLDVRSLATDFKAYYKIDAVAGTAIGTKYGKEITLYLNEKDKPKSSATIKSDSTESAAPME